MEETKTLVELQKADLGIFQLEQSKKEYPGKVDELQKAVQKAQTDLEEIRKKAEEMEEKKKKIEKELLQIQEQMKKSQERLNHIQTNREYDAVHEEIATHQNRSKALSDQSITLKEDIEKATKESEIAQAWLLEIQNKNQPEIDKLTLEISQIDGKIQEARNGRKAIIGSMNPKILKSYERILKGRKTGRVIGFVSSVKRNCSYCCKTLTLQQVNEVRRNDALNLCDNCGSILIWTEQENGKG